MELTARILCAVCALVGASMAVGDKARLMMNSTGEFKLAIFADCKCVCAHQPFLLYSLYLHTTIVMIHSDCTVHYGEGESTEWGPEQDAVSHYENSPTVTVSIA